MPRSTWWVIADTGGTTVISLVSMLVMARLLGPRDFGSAALAIGVVQVVNLYVEGLLHDALIQNRGVDEAAFDQGFWFVTGLGAAISAVGGLAALALHGTGAGPLAMLIFAASTSLPFSGMTGVCNARSRRDMDYRMVAAPSVFAKLLSALTGPILAATGFGAPSLIVPFVAATMAQSGGLLLISGWRPRFRLSVTALRPLWHFALPYAVMHTLVGLRIQAFTALIAAFGGLAAAGYINIAFRLTLAPQILLTTSLTNVGLPFLAREQHDRTALEGAFHTLNRLTAFGLPVVFVGVAVCAGPIVRVLLGSEWIPSIVPIQVFGIGAALYMLRMPSSLLLRALGHVRYSLLNAIMHLVVTLGGMALLRPRGPLIASLLWVVPLLPLVPLTLEIIRREAKISLGAQLRDMVAPSLCLAGMVAGVMLTETMLRGVSAPTLLAAGVVNGALIYAVLVVALDSEARALLLGRLRGRRLIPRRS